MQKMQHFSGEWAQPPPRPIHQWEGDMSIKWRYYPLPTSHPRRRLWRLDLNPSHSEILSTLLRPAHLDGGATCCGRWGPPFWVAVPQRPVPSWWHRGRALRGVYVTV